MDGTGAATLRLTVQHRFLEPDELQTLQFENSPDPFYS
jgi:hypothetical protein